MHIVCIWFTSYLLLGPNKSSFQLEHVADTWNDTDKAIYDNLTVTLKKAVPDFGKLDPNSTSFTIKGCYQNEVNGSIIDNGIGKIWQFSRIEFREMLFNRAVDNKQLFPPNASARCLDSIHYRPAGRRHRSPNVIDLPPKSKLDGWLAALSWKDLMPKPEGKVNPKPASGKTKPQKSPSCKPPLGKLPSGQKGSGQGGQPIGIPVA
jgi:hypothetical protein